MNTKKNDLQTHLPLYRKELRTIKGLKYFRLNALEVA